MEQKRKGWARLRVSAFCRSCLLLPATALHGAAPRSYRLLLLLLAAAAAVLLLLLLLLLLLAAAAAAAAAADAAAYRCHREGLAGFLPLNLVHDFELNIGSLLMDLSMLFKIGASLNFRF